jgi:hypothetical protein
MNSHATLAHCNVEAYGAPPSRHDDASEMMTSMHKLFGQPQNRDLRSALRGDVACCVPFAMNSMRPI